MPKQPIEWQRKNEHIFLAEKYYQKHNPFFDEMRLMPVSIPNIALDQVDIHTAWKQQQADGPLYINAMTGGSPQTIAINQKLATLAATLKIPLAVGSMSNYLKYPAEAEIRRSYTIVRESNPHGIIWANVSAHTPWADAQKCIDLIQADALQVHLNAAQETIMPEGDSNFVWQENLRQILKHISVPIIIKEVGFGMTAQTVQQLQELGARIIDISGRGGTNFAQIENTRNHQKDYQFLNDWGLTTLESLLDTQKFQSQSCILASGGVRSPLDVIKCLVLGAHAVGIAAPVLHLLEHQGLAATTKYFAQWLEQIRELMALLGCHNCQELQQVDYRLSANLQNFLTSRT